MKIRLNRLFVLWFASLFISTVAAGQPLPQPDALMEQVLAAAGAVYADVPSGHMPGIADYHFEMLGTEPVEGHKTYVIAGRPKDARRARELGHSLVVWHIDPDIHASRLTEYWDLGGGYLKAVENRRFTWVDSRWIAVHTNVENYKRGYSTRLTRYLHAAAGGRVR